MRILLTNKPIPSWYLKKGWDNGSYDAEKLIWLPGRTTPIRVPDLKLAGLHRMGEARDATVAPPVRKKVVPNAPGLYVPPGYLAREQRKASNLSSAALAAK